ncbi:hypothetical protein BB934_22310 [Microvirga ossetica]|uniref:Calcium-binding protein n=1 Tax=Microvirga ossetica TaxID=1882682 RepID=A0A1B2EKV2_9HYPH|nr:calcium-binding protein [Microvirga ossetica]ANY80625.1 hypothetical protein BB934_22310 [Microvirga ossetica]
MAHFVIENIAGRGGYVPFANTTLADMTGSYALPDLIADNGSFASFHMVGTAFDIGSNYTWHTGSTYTFHDIGVFSGGTIIGGIIGLNMTVNHATGATISNTVVNSGNDWFEGNDYADLIHGGAGDDAIEGWGDNDSLYGDGGNDAFFGGAGNDYIDGGIGLDGVKYHGSSSDYSFAVQGNGDVVVTDKRGLAGSDYLTSVEVFQFENGSFSLGQLVTPSAPPVPPTPPAQPVLPVEINGTGGNDYLIGNALDNVIVGGAGRDTMWGKAGRDAFVFDTSPKSGRDFIKDFRIVDDTIMLDNADFTKVGGNGKLKAGAFHINLTGKAHDASDRAIYDKYTGKLYYDSDGTGAKAGICFSDISKNLKLTAADFYVL